MAMKELIVRALYLAGRADAARALEDGGELPAEASEAVRTMLYCANAAEDELARYYFPLEYTETIRSSTGRYDFKKFRYSPVEILKVTDEKDNEITFGRFKDYISAGEAVITVTYRYAPDKKQITDGSEFESALGGEIPALGAAAEYCLINGESGLAEALEVRYRAALDRALKIPSGAVISPRRWL